MISNNNISGGIPVELVEATKLESGIERKRQMGSSGFSWKLNDHPKLPKGKTVAMVVLDGWGEDKPN
ncbi:2,3-bisphosphoglycerate-independent phosphoglycerate mutase [Sesbania bispinosa]|nr:2,3-bisphosphoglycerate-independent phosphoglycerate mutase [Sesbania bispinosa]